MARFVGRGAGSSQAGRLGERQLRSRIFSFRNRSGRNATLVLQT